MSRLWNEARRACAVTAITLSMLACADDDPAATGAGGTGPASSATSSAAKGGGGGGAGGEGPAPTDAKGVVAELCPELASESIVCIGFVNGVHITALGLDSGDMCELSVVAGDAPYEVSIALVGTDVLYCDAYGLVRAPLAGGPVETVSIGCGGVFNFEGGIGVAPYGQGPLVTFYDSFDDVVVANSSASQQIELNAAAHASFRGTLWATPQIVEAFYAFVPPATMPVEEVPIDSAYALGTVQGLSVVDEDTIVFGHPFAIYEVSAASGDVLREVDPGIRNRPLGLACWRAP